VAKQQFVHRAQLVYDISDLNPSYHDRLNAASSYFTGSSGDPTAISGRALRLIDQAVNSQAALLSYRDVFYFVGFIFLCVLPLILLLGKAAKPVPAPVES